MAKIYSNITEIIGSTLLLRLSKLTAGLNADVLVKLESSNPYSSVKDRIGFSMIKDAEEKGMKGAIEKAEELLKNTKGAFMPKQLKNPANPKIHRETTAEEIWKDTDGKVDIFVSGVGTGGTITGVGEVLKARNPKIQIIAVEPEASAARTRFRA